MMFLPHRIHSITKHGEEKYILRIEFFPQEIDLSNRIITHDECFTVKYINKDFTLKSFTDKEFKNAMSDMFNWLKQEGYL